MNIKYFVLLLLLPSLGWSSTFVGNGGTSGDVELAVAQKTILSTLQVIKSQPQAEICVCSDELSEHPICDVLKRLNDTQRDFCAEFVRKQTSFLIFNLSDNDRVSYSWTNSSIEVEEASGLRGAEAVTDPQRKTITLLQDRFMNMKPYERVFLLSHELLHLSKWEGELMKDDGPIGPFTGKDGGRQLLNAAGAGIAMAGYDAGLYQKYSSNLNRSRSYKNNWLGGSLLSVSSGYDDTSIFQTKSSSGSELSYRRDFDSFGLMLRYRYLVGKRELLSTIKIEEVQHFYGIAGTYKIRPFSDPMSVLGQSYFLLALGYENLASVYNLKDDTVKEQAKASSNSWTGDCYYFTPLQSGMWLQFNIGYTQHRYSYDLSADTVEYNRSQLAVGIGVNYGF